MAAYSTINKSTSYQSSFIYTGTGSANSFTDPGFQVDMQWTKRRDTTSNHVLSNSLVGVGKNVYPDLNDGQATEAQGVTAFDSDGYDVGTDSNWNGSGGTYASWNWLAGTTSGLSGGTITPASYSINTTSKFGMYKFTGTGSTGTIAHGLGVIPRTLIIKRLDTTAGWALYHWKMGAGKYLKLDENGNATTSSDWWNDTNPDATVFTLGSNGDVNGSGGDYMAYAFGEVQGYSKFGTYVGNGTATYSSTDVAPFIYTGFRPSFLMVKKYDGGGTAGWEMFDDKRAGYNDANYKLVADTNDAENTDTGRINLLTNGFKITTTGTGLNYSAADYVYWAFGQTLVGSNGIVGTAR